MSGKTVSIPNGDGRVNSRIENYTAFFDNDSSKDTEEHKKNRLENYTDVVNGASRRVFPAQLGTAR